MKHRADRHRVQDGDRGGVPGGDGQGERDGDRPGSFEELIAAVGVAHRQLARIYRIDLDHRAEHFVVDPALAREVLPDERAARPRSGLLVIQEAGEVWLGLYVDPRDYADPATVIEETSHWLCVAWHAAQDRSVSLLGLELQAEIDRYALERVEGREGLDHFHGVRWQSWMDAATRERYRAAHRAALRYCRRLSGRYPRPADTPALLAELRRFYRKPLAQKLDLLA